MRKLTCIFFIILAVFTLKPNFLLAELPVVDAGANSALTGVFGSSIMNGINATTHALDQLNTSIDIYKKSLDTLSTMQDIYHTQVQQMQTLQELKDFRGDPKAWAGKLSDTVGMLNDMANTYSKEGYQTADEIDSDGNSWNKQMATYYGQINQETYDVKVTNPNAEYDLYKKMGKAYSDYNKLIKKNRKEKQKITDQMQKIANQMNAGGTENEHFQLIAKQKTLANMLNIYNDQEHNAYRNITALEGQKKLLDQTKKSLDISRTNYATKAGNEEMTYKTQDEAWDILSKGEPKSW